MSENKIEITEKELEIMNKALTEVVEPYSGEAYEEIILLLGKRASKRLENAYKVAKELKDEFNK